MLVADLARAARTAGVRARHRVHRPRDRAGRRARRDRGERLRPADRGLGRAGGRGGRGARGRAAAHLDRAQAAGGAGGADRRSCSCWPRPRRSCCSRTTRTAARTSRTCSPARSSGCRTSSSSATAILTAVFAVVWFLWRERIGRIGFYVLFASWSRPPCSSSASIWCSRRLIVPAVATYRYAGQAPACDRLRAGDRELRRGARASRWSRTCRRAR